MNKCGRKWMPFIARSRGGSLDPDPPARRLRAGRGRATRRLQCCARAMAEGKFNQELIKAGVLLAAEGLQASSKGARVKFAGEKRMVIDGPFAETKELVAGFWLWKCASLQEAIEWVKRCPNPMPGEEAEMDV